MAYDEILADKIRKALLGKIVEEKKAFGGLMFMINGKLAITVNMRPDHIIMVHIDPMNTKALQKKGAKIAVMRGKQMPGWIFLEKEAIASEKNFSYWIQLALEYNRRLTK